MHHEARSRRFKAQLKRAVNDILGKKLTYREAESKYRIPKSTILRAVALATSVNPQTKPDRVPCLNNFEEGLLVQLLNRYADRGIPLNRSHLIEATALIVARMSKNRRESLPFKDGKPGYKWVRNFQKRHEGEIKFLKPTRQEAVCFAACNGETFATHFATLEKLVQENRLDATRVWNLDESGATPGKDVEGRTTSQRYLQRNGIKDVQLAHFLNLHRVTMVLVISAAGDMGPPLFVFKGKKMPYRTILHDGQPVHQGPADLLPCHSIIAMREENGGVDMRNFLNWGYAFVDSVKDLTADGKKVLLIYDAYRSHITLNVLDLFHSNNIIVYALPAHTSGKTQPLDVVMFSPFKKALNESIHVLYRRAGIWPVDSTKFFSVPRPKSGEDVSEILDVQRLENLMEEKREALKQTILGHDAVMTKSGYVDTTKGMALTSTQALKLIRDKVERNRTVALAKELEANRKAAVQAVRLAKRRREVERLKKLELERRSAMANMSLQQFKGQLRPMAQRRAVARLAKKEKTQKLVENETRQAAIANYLQTLELNDGNDVAP